jgi:hypothetical protein
LAASKTLWRALKTEYGLTLNDFIKIPPNRNTTYAIEARKRYCTEALSLIMTTALFHAVYIDETPWALGENLVKGRCIGGGRPVLPAERRPESSMTVIAAMSPSSGFLHAEFRAGRVTAEEIRGFVGRLRHSLTQSGFFLNRRAAIELSLRAAGVDENGVTASRILSKAFIVWDNASIHQQGIVEEFGELEQHRLPPYSPFLNPIEESFAFLKFLFIHGENAKDATTKELLRQESTTVQTAVLAIMKTELNDAFCKRVHQHSMSFWVQCASGIPVESREILDRCHEGDEISIAVNQAVMELASRIENLLDSGAEGTESLRDLLSPEQAAALRWRRAPGAESSDDRGAEEHDSQSEGEELARGDSSIRQ